MCENQEERKKKLIESERKRKTKNHLEISSDIFALFTHCNLKRCLYNGMKICTLEENRD